MQEIGRIREQWAVLIPVGRGRGGGISGRSVAAQYHAFTLLAYVPYLPLFLSLSIEFLTVARFVQTSKSCRFSDPDSDRTEEEIWWKMIIPFDRILSIEPFYNLFDWATRKFLNDPRTLLDFDDIIYLQFWSVDKSLNCIYSRKIVRLFI